MTTKIPHLVGAGFIFKAFYFKAFYLITLKALLRQPLQVLRMAQL